MPLMHQRPTGLEWGLRAVLAGLAAVIGYASVSQTVATTLQFTAPDRAQALALFGNGAITAALAQQIAIRNDATASDRARADALARKALQQDATAVLAVSTLGLDAQLRNDAAGARRLFQYAEQLSRRDVQTQLWAIEDSVEHGDTPGALRHYDIALRTSDTAAPLLLPVLTNAMADPTVRAQMVQTLAARPPWSDAFISYAAGNNPDPRVNVELFTAAERKGASVPDQAQAAVISALVAKHYMDDAWAYYASHRQGASRTASRDPAFRADLTAPSLFDWNPLNSGALSASLQHASFSFSAPPSVGGPVLQQVQMLPPGEYRLEGHSSGLEQAAEALPYWTLICEDGHELGRVVMQNSAQNGGRFSGALTVPSQGCPVQTLAMIVKPSEAMQGLSGEIDQLRLVPNRTPMKAGGQNQAPLSDHAKNGVGEVRRPV